MKDEITFCVTQKDIDEGKINNRHSCMVARSISRRLNPNYTVGVNASSAGIKEHDQVGGKHIASFWLGDRVREKIVEYDFGKAVKPFRFTVKVPEKLRKAFQAFN